jgi:transglutaminase-like putative cysteine protease
MTQLRIRHRTHYRYDAPVEFGRHRLVLRPREGHDLRVCEMSLAIAPAHLLTWTRDVYGNSVALVDFEAPSSSLEIASEVVVERWPRLPRAGLPRPWSAPYPVQYDAIEAPIVAAYQNATFPDETASIREWTDNSIPAPTRIDAEEMMLRLCATISKDIDYLRRSEKGVQSPAVTLQRRTGSCRDTATLMLEAARTLGIAARFVSGYLHCAASDAGRASTHAWMEAYLPAFGWRGFDPSIGEPASDKHIAVGVSQHPRGVMPISGVWSAQGARFIEMDVQVTTTELASGDADASEDELQTLASPLTRNAPGLTPAAAVETRVK